MDSTTRFSSNFSTLTTRISRGWSIRLSLLRTRSKRWRRMARGNVILKTIFRKQHQASLALARTFVQKPEHGSPTDVWIASSILDAATKLSGVASELPYVEASIASTTPKRAGTILPDHAARPLPNRSNLTECTSSRKLKWRSLF
jgi:hypothetical protein